MNVVTLPASMNGTGVRKKKYSFVYPYILFRLKQRVNCSSHNQVHRSMSDSYNKPDCLSESGKMGA